VVPVVSAPVKATAVDAGPISAPMVAALEGAWAAISARHPEIPQVVMVLGAGSIGGPGGRWLGHSAAMRWADPDQQPTEQPNGDPDDEPGEDEAL
jgi:hypothetical protein